MVAPTLMRDLHITVADDDRDMREWLAQVLTPLAACIRQAVNGRDVWSALESESADIVICDVRMPLQSGIAVLTGIRLAGNQVPFLLITGFGGEDVRDLAARLDAEVLDKPFTAIELITRVRAMVEARSRRSATDDTSRGVLQHHTTDE